MKEKKKQELQRKEREAQDQGEEETVVINHLCVPTNFDIKSQVDPNPTAKPNVLPYNHYSFTQVFLSSYCQGQSVPPINE